jgi:hypothetical protein
LPVHPVKKAFSGGGPNAIQVGGDNLQGMIFIVKAGKISAIG